MTPGTAAATPATWTTSATSTDPPSPGPGRTHRKALVDARLGNSARQAIKRQIEGPGLPRPEDTADAVSCIATRGGRVAVNEILVRAREQTWYLAQRKHPLPLYGP